MDPGLINIDLGLMNISLGLMYIILGLMNIILGLMNIDPEFLNIINLYYKLFMHEIKLCQNFCFGRKKICCLFSAR